MRSSTARGESRLTLQLRLGKYFGTSAQFWLNLQTHYDLDRAEDRAMGQIEAIEPIANAC